MGKAKVREESQHLFGHLRRIARVREVVGHSKRFPDLICDCDLVRFAFVLRQRDLQSRLLLALCFLVSQRLVRALIGGEFRRDLLGRCRLRLGQAVVIRGQAGALRQKHRGCPRKHFLR